jgi:hypothetical protein
VSADRTAYDAAVLADVLEERGFDPVVLALAVAELSRRGEAPREGAARLVAALLAGSTDLLRDVAVLTRGVHDCILRTLSADTLGGVRSPTMVRDDYLTYIHGDEPSYHRFDSYDKAEQALLEQHAHLSIVIVVAAR